MNKGLIALQKEGALLQGHFELHSGRHSAHYIEKNILFRRPRLTSVLCRRLAKMLVGRHSGTTAPLIDVVVGPVSGGAIVAHWLAYHLEMLTKTPVIALSTKRDSENFHRFSAVDSAEIASKNVIVADDVLSTGKTLKELVNYLRGLNCGLESDGRAGVVAAAVLFDRRACGSHEIFGIPLYSLFPIPLASWDKEDCPLCKQGIALIKM